MLLFLSLREFVVGVTLLVPLPVCSGRNFIGPFVNL